MNNQREYLKNRPANEKTYIRLRNIKSCGKLYSQFKNKNSKDLGVKCKREQLAFRSRYNGK